MNLSRLNWILIEQFGIDIKKIFKSIPRFIKYLSDIRKFKSLNYDIKIEYMPCIHDRYEESGSIGDEYFWQDLYVAQEIFKSSPIKHVDVGSRLDGFVAHISSFRFIEVLDIRPLSSIIPNVMFTQCDITQMDSSFVNYSDSVSCLHTLEHFGLGRYGDKIDINAPYKGLSNLANILRENGVLYLSTPVGSEKIYFNAHRVFDIYSLLDVVKVNGLVLESLAYKIPREPFTKSDNLDEDLVKLHNVEYALAVLTLRKIYENK